MPLDINELETENNKSDFKKCLNHADSFGVVEFHDEEFVKILKSTIELNEDHNL